MDTYQQLMSDYTKLDMIISQNTDLYPKEKTILKVVKQKLSQLETALSKNDKGQIRELSITARILLESIKPSSNK